ncbi:MAG: ACP S-malonyltransferase [Candidatus Competibacteraceae bacterium]
MVFVAGRAVDALLRQLGVQPDLLLGHSTGENGALMASGLFQLDEQSLSDCVRRMNQNYRVLEAAGELPPGVLLSVGGVSLEQVRAMLAAGELYVTMDNCDHQFILFGTDAAITAAHEKLRQEGALCVRLPMGRGYHTPLMEPMARAFRSVFEAVTIGEPNGQVYSCVAAAPFPTEPAEARDMAASQYRLPVRFRESIQRLHADGARLFVEVGPSGYLTGFVRDSLRGQPHLAVASDDRRRDDLTPLRHLLATLFVQGVALDLEPLYGRPEAPPGKPAPYLSTAIPVIGLGEAETRQMREWLAVTPAVETTPAAAPSLLANVTTLAATPPPLLDKEGKMTRVNRRQAALNGHLQLMQEFLSQQERVMMTWLSRRRPR